MKTAFIFAAGRGERFRTFTQFKPKPLYVVRSMTLIEHHVTNLKNAGFERLIINHAYLGGQIRACLGSGARFGLEIIYSPEPPGALETGGGIANALPLLGRDPFITVNADIVTDYPFESLKLPTNSLAHLVLVPRPPYRNTGDFSLLENRITNHPPEHVYGCIACYHPEFFADASIGRYSIVPLLRAQVRANLVTGEYYTGAWFDIGSHAQATYCEANTIS